jgi:anti-anti-sigma regulatory factor
MVLQPSGPSKGRKARNHIGTSCPNAHEVSRPGLAGLRVSPRAQSAQNNKVGGVPHRQHRGCARLWRICRCRWLRSSTSVVVDVEAGHEPRWDALPWRVQGAADDRVGARGALTPSLAFLERERGDMIVAVFEPPPRIDASNVAKFAATVSEYVARHGCMVINCSRVMWIASSAMRFLEIASHEAQIVLVNPSPAVHLMAATFAGDVRLGYDPVWSPPSVPEVPTRRLAPVHTAGKVAS